MWQSKMWQMWRRKSFHKRRLFEIFRVSVNTERRFFPFDSRIQVMLSHARGLQGRRKVGVEHQLKRWDGESQKVWNLDEVVVDQDAVERPEGSGQEVWEDHGEGQDVRRASPDHVRQRDQRGREKSDWQRTPDLEMKIRHKLYKCGTNIFIVKTITKQIFGL